MKQFIKYASRILNDKVYLKIKFFIKMKKKLNLKNPQTFNEKLQWLKLYDRRNVFTKMVDKYDAKKYVADIIGKEYIIPTIDIYDCFEEIDFDKLPNQFVIKCTHDSCGLVIVRDKKKINIEDIKTKIEKSLKYNYYYSNREWPYKNVKPRIIIEKYMQDRDLKELRDYKFYCFNGHPKYLYVSEGLENHATAKIEFFDMNFKSAPFGRNDFKKFDKKPEKPKQFEKMQELAKILSSGVPFLRVDFYEINGKIYFGELTFSPCGGFMHFEPEEWDYKLGQMIDLHSVKK